LFWTKIWYGVERNMLCSIFNFVGCSRFNMANCLKAAFAEKALPSTNHCGSLGFGVGRNKKINSA